MKRGIVMIESGARREAVSAPEPGDQTRATHGRPMSSAADEAITRAAIDLLAEVGFNGVSMEAVAHRAGVSKATLYRRFKGKEELVSSTLVDLTVRPGTAAAGAATAHDELLVAFRTSTLMASSPSWQAVLGAVLCASPDDPLVDSVRRGVFEHSIAGTGRLIDAGVLSGEIRPGTSAEKVLNLLIGALIARRIVGGDFGEDWMVEIMEMLWRGIAGPNDPTLPSSGGAVTELVAGSAAPLSAGEPVGASATE
jgi:AcrR family transcriptional regulator